MIPVFLRMRLRNQQTGEHIVVDVYSDESIKARGEGAHLLKTDYFEIDRRVHHADATHYEIVGNVDIIGPVPA